MDKVTSRAMERIAVQLEQRDRERAQKVEQDIEDVEQSENEQEAKGHTTAADVSMDLDRYAER